VAARWVMAHDKSSSRISSEKGTSRRVGMAMVVEMVNWLWFGCLID